MQKKCPSCGAYTDNKANFCPNCGKSMTGYSRYKKSISQSHTSKGKNNSSATEGFLILLGCIVFVYSSTKGSIVEFFNGITYQENIWCGTYSKYKNEVRILKQDVEKGGSSICLESESWKDSVHIKLGGKKDPSYDNFDHKIIMLEAKINDGTFTNIKNIREWKK